MPSKQVLKCTKALAKAGLTISFAESATAGRLASEFSMTPNSGKVLKGGIVCYDATVKEDLLKVDRALIRKYTPESAEVTECICKSITGLFKSDVYGAVTGLTTSGGSELPEKPVGTMFIHILYKDQSLGFREVFQGSPEQIVLQSIDRFCSLLTEMIAAADK